MSVPSFQKLSPNMDMNTLVSALNTNFNQLQAESRRKVVTDESGVDRIVIGKLESGDYGIEVSGAGYDVDTATNGQKVMSSEWMMWKIVDSGQTGVLSASSYRRAGTLALTSTYIGYISDIMIPIANLNPLVAYTETFESRIQVFVRNYLDKMDIATKGGIWRDASGNWLTVQYKYWIEPNTNYLIIRTVVRWMAGSVTITPQSQFISATKFYWEIANPTRVSPPGGGGGGPSTTNYIYYDNAIYTPETASWSSVYSTSIAVPDTASYNTFTVDYEPTPFRV